MPIKQNLWLSDPSRLAPFLSVETAQDKFNWCTSVAEGTDMGPCGWVKVGEAELLVTFFPSAPLRESAAVAVDIALAELAKTFEEKRNILEELRQTFLCLEAPLNPAPQKADDDLPR